MTSHQQRPIVAVFGSGITLWFPVALLAAYLPKHSYQIIAIDTQQEQTHSAASFITRPSIHQAHHVLGIEPSMLAQHAAARPVHAMPINSKSKDFYLPYGDYGVPPPVSAFHHYWLRAQQAGKARPIADYNLALRLNQVQGFLGQKKPGLPELNFAYQLSHNAYSKLLRHVAFQHGVTLCQAKYDSLQIDGKGNIEKVVFEQGSITPHLVFCFSQPHVNKQDLVTMIGDGNNGFYIDGCVDCTGVNLQYLHNIIKRILAFWPDGSFSAVEKTVLMQLLAQEKNTILDMKLLIKHGLDGAKRSDTLSRKCRAYANRGVIPSEDYEFYGHAEWLSILNTLGVIPRQYDRIVDTLSLEQSVMYVNKVVHAIDQLLQKPT